MTPVARFDTQTLFQIDPQWLKEDSQSARKEIHASLCDDCRARYPDPEVARAVDRVHPLTGEVTRVDMLWESVVDHFARQSEYITSATPLATGVFRALLANGNQPMSSEQLYQRIRKNSAEGILRMLNKGTDIEFVVPAANAKV